MFNCETLMRMCSMIHNNQVQYSNTISQIAGQCFLQNVSTLFIMKTMVMIRKPTLNCNNSLAYCCFISYELCDWYLVFDVDY